MFSLGTLLTLSDNRIIATLDNGSRYYVWNKEEIPEKNKGFGLFQYEPQDQYCRWVDVKRLEMKKD